MRTRNVDRSKYRNYLLKSEEFLVTAGEALERARYNASVLNSVHAIISAADALSVFVKGFRYAGTRHEEAVELFSGIFPGDRGHEKNVSRFGTILSIKNKAEYLEVLLSSKDAADALRDATRFTEYVRGKLP
ncbi:MAG: HEPN domain-containing protein [Candidatus Hodarchaeaceae archaeon]|nr:HEPN domain-containing protein [Candidatus Hodarchaeaceae archaeon]